MESPLKKEFEYYLAHQGELVEKYNGKFVVIHEGVVVAVFDTEMAAIKGGIERGLKPGTYLVQYVSPGDSAYSQTFHSLVAFG